MGKFQQLKSLEIFYSDITVIPANIPWPTSIENITIYGNENLETIEPFAFSSAINLKRLNLVGSGYDQNRLTIKSNAFHTTSPLHKTLEMTPSKNVIFESNCFGNVDGGQLWDVLDIATNGFGEHVFPEDAFRLLLKAHFDKGHKSKYIYLHISMKLNIIWNLVSKFIFSF